MRRLLPTLTILLVLLSLSIVAAEETRSEEEAEAAAMVASIPGSAHVKLARIVGEYTTTSRFMPHPDADVVKSGGTATITSTLGGRFLLEQNDGEMMDQPISGLRLWGYNNASERYEGVWTFTMSTAIMTLSGISEDSGKTIDWTGAYDDADGNVVTAHIVTRYPESDRFVVEVYHDAEDGTEFLILETTYERK